MILDICGGCGDDLEDGVEHDCPVLGTTVMAESILYVSSNNGEVYCKRHADRPSDIHIWTRLTHEEALTWNQFMRDEMNELILCEACRSEGKVTVIDYREGIRGGTK